MAWVGVITDAGRDMYNRFSQGNAVINMSSLKLGTGTWGDSEMRSKTDIKTILLKR